LTGGGWAGIGFQDGERGYAGAGKQIGGIREEVEILATAYSMAYGDRIGK
jgi:hypothetical protein